MKKVLNLGKTLSKTELKVVIGGTYGCASLYQKCNAGYGRCCIGTCLPGVEQGIVVYRCMIS